MAGIIQEFQSQLINKLQYKASSKISLDSFLLKCFKFFDLYNNGHLNKIQFFKAIAKCGMVVDAFQIDEIFKHYDFEEKGIILYKNFIENLLFKDESNDNESKISKSQNREYEQKINNQFHQIPTSKFKQNISLNSESMKQSKIDKLYKQCQTYQEIKNTINKYICSKGISGLLQLANNLKARDSKKCHSISDKQLHAQLPFLNDENIKTLILQFDKQDSHQINYAQLIYSLKGQSDEKKQVLINETFNYLDQEGKKQFKVKDLLSKFKNKMQYDQFKKAVDLYCLFQGIDDGYYTDEDFTDFFEFIAFGLQSFQIFHLYIRKSFFQEEVRSIYSQQSKRSRQFSNQQRQKDSKYKKSRNNEEIQMDFRKQKKQQESHAQNYQNKKQSHIQKSQSRYSNMEQKSNTSNFIRQVQQIILRIKKRLASKGTKGFLLFEKALKNIDTDEDNLISYDEFKRVIIDQRIDITATESNLVFDVFDQQGTGYIDFQELVHTFKGSMPQTRKQYFSKLWQQVQVNDQTTSFPTIKHALTFKGHPDVQNGRKYEEDILKEIQDTILLIQDFNQRPRSERIMKKQFEEYFENLSLSIIDDQLFEAIMMNFWRVSTSHNITDKYAGSRKMFDPNKKGYLMDHHRHTVKGGSVSQNAPFGTFQDPVNYLTQHNKL